MAASALASYPGEDTVFCLKEGLKAANWYVRLNCAEALIYGLGISRLRLFDVETEETGMPGKLSDTFWRRNKSDSRK